MPVDLNTIFSPAAVAQSLKVLPPLETTIMDRMFKERPTHPLPLIGLSDLISVVQTVPVVRRDGAPIALKGGKASMDFIAPCPIKVKIPVSASELNDLRVVMGNSASVASWRTRKVDQIRKAVRDTTEAMCSVVVTTGALSWPMEEEGGRRSVYEIDYGAPLSVTPPVKLSAASSVADVYDLLDLMEEKIRQAGVGGNVEFWAGRDVVRVLLKMAEQYKSTANGTPYSLKVEQGQIIVAGYAIQFMKEMYPSPDDESVWLRKLDPKTLLATATNPTGAVWYCAIDSISAQNAAVPLHIIPVPRDDDTGYTLIGQAKPLPARASRATCKAVVVD